MVARIVNLVIYGLVETNQTLSFLDCQVQGILQPRKIFLIYSMASVLWNENFCSKTC